MKVLLVVNNNKKAAVSLSREIAEALGKTGAGVRSYSFGDGAPLEEAGFDIAFSLGGDGTVLFTARTVSCYGTPIIPVNIGTLGFIASVLPADWKKVFADWRDGKAAVSARLMLDVRVERAGKAVYALSGLNDAVISASGIAKTIRLEAWTNNEHIGSYRSDGLIAATPTGSTAYSSSAGGPILDPEIEAVILNPICPFMQLYRPAVLPAEYPITIRVGTEQRSGVLLTVDGQLTEELEPGDLVIIRKSCHKALLAGCGRDAFYKALRNKLAFLSGGDLGGPGTGSGGPGNGSDTGNGGAAG